MKTSNGKIEIEEVDKDFPIREQRLLINIFQHGWLAYADFYLTKGQARTLGKRLLRWGSKV